MSVSRFLGMVASLCLALATPMASFAKPTDPILVTGQLANGFTYSLYPSDDSETAEHKEDVNLTLLVGIGGQQDINNQPGVAKLVGAAAREYLRYSRAEFTKFGFDIIDINDEILLGKLRFFKSIADGQFVENANLNVEQKLAVKLFVGKWYQPQFMHLAIAGQIDVTKVKRQIETLFGGLKSTKILRTPYAFYNPVAGLSHVSASRNDTDILRILIKIDESKAKLQAFEPTVIGIQIRATIRNEARRREGFEYDESNFTTYNGKSYIQIAVRHDNIPIKAAEWILGQVAEIGNIGILKKDLSGFRMWLMAEGIDHFSPFKPDGKPYEIASRLAYRQANAPYELLTSEEEATQAQYFLDNMNYKALDKLLKQLLAGEIRIIAIQKSDMTAKQKLDLQNLIKDYNRNK